MNMKDYAVWRSGDKYFSNEVVKRNTSATYTTYKELSYVEYCMYVLGGAKNIDAQLLRFPEHPWKIPV